MHSEHEDQHKSLGDRTDSSNSESEQERLTLENFVAPGVPIVRDSTPRLFSFSLADSGSGQSRGAPQLGPEAAVFPMEAPSAPPLPEEYNASTKEALRPPEMTPLPGRAESSSESSEAVFSEFVWLFEYGLEMDGMLLNSLERLHGLALLYGPAVLRGYEITFSAVSSRAELAAAAIATIVSSSKPGAEVWGVLYRIPLHLVESPGSELAHLDKIHDAMPPRGLFERISVVVHEPQREREIACITYIASVAARNLFHPRPFERQAAEEAYVQQLLEVAKKQKLPVSYLQRLAEITPPLPAIAQSPVPPEQDTEPLPVVRTPQNNTLPSTPPSRKMPPSFGDRGIITFAVYIVLSLLLVFTLATLQALGAGGYLFPATFTPLGIPWFVAVYGYIGSCLSCSVRLARQHKIYPPAYVVIIWFTRPFIGVILAVTGYLLLNSGLFVLSGAAEQHKMLYSLLAVLFGFCEGWLFYRRR